MNRVIMIGNLTKDPELKYTPQGLPVATFSIAVNRPTKTPQGDYEVDFFNCVAWRQRAEFVSQYVTKGRKVAVEGRLQTRNFVGQDGVKRYFTEIVVDNVETVGPPREGAGGAAGAPSHAGGPEMGAPPVENDIDEFADPFSEA